MARGAIDDRFEPGFAPAAPPLSSLYSAWKLLVSSVPQVPASVRWTCRVSADQAGLAGITRTSSGRIALGDAIVAVDGKAVRSGDDLYHVFEAAGVGATVSLTVERDGKKRDVTVKLVPLD
jgi:S1-C subfamily serine protease